jgi:uncharacterized membrane protein
MIALFFILVQINLLSFGFIEIGIPHHYIFTPLLATLFGSFINIPLKKIPQEDMVSQERIRVDGGQIIVLQNDHELSAVAMAQIIK